MKRSVITQMFSLLIVSVVVVSGCNGGLKGNSGPWVDLFDGKTLAGWEQKNGEAKYEVVDGQIVGTSVMGTPNSFLCTKELYTDFILELEFMVDPLLNSGVQIRSNSFPEYNNYRVHGYQVEIDPSDRAYSAGVYDEARRGWLNNLADNEPARKAFKQNKWNKLRVEAIGDTIKTWINGVPAAHFLDDMTAKGFIALQVHGIGKNKEKDGTQVKWRKIRIITDNPAKYSKSSPVKPIVYHNTLCEKEKKAKWGLLFDGKTSKGWRGAKLDAFPKGGWKIKDGILTIHESGGRESAAAGDIVTTQKYKDFELSLSFKITPGANSGIKYYVDTQLNKGKGSSIGLEYQILDDKRHPDAKKGSHKGSRKLACLYDLIAAKNIDANPIGQWNHARLVSKKGKVEHWLNGRKVLAYDRFSDAHRKLVSESKYKNWPSFGELPEGEILLQDHGNTVSFRTIKIRKL